MRRIVHTWLPLAASWLLMAAEIPMMSAVIARLAQPEVNLAALGGVVYPLASLVESPIIMLLSTSNALGKDWDSYLKLRRFTACAGALLTLVHVLIAFTPLYYLVTVRLISAPPQVVEPARLGLMIMTPWTWSIAYRRFNQGMLIRFGRSRAVSLGTAVRLGVDVLVLAAGYRFGVNPSVVVATTALSAGVLSEATCAGLCVRPVVRGHLRAAAPTGRSLTVPDLLRFYVPLAITPMLDFLLQPVTSAAISRMPQALDSLAAWPVVFRSVMLLRSLGLAYNEVVITLLDEPRSTHALCRFAALLTALTTVLLLVVAATPLAPFWFARVAGLNPRLAAMAGRGLWVALPLPGLTVLRTWYQGMLVHSHRTRSITAAMLFYAIANGAMLFAGVASGWTTGLYVGLAALGVGAAFQTAWLWVRSRPAMRALEAHAPQHIPR